MVLRLTRWAHDRKPRGSNVRSVRLILCRRCPLHRSMQYFVFVVSKTDGASVSVLGFINSRPVNGNQALLALCHDDGVSSTFGSTICFGRSPNGVGLCLACWSHNRTTRGTNHALLAVSHDAVPSSTVALKICLVDFQYGAELSSACWAHNWKLS